MRTLPLAAALALLATPALAATVGTIPVDPDRHVSGTLAAGGRQTWRLDLERGRYYAVWGDNDGRDAGIDVAVRAAGGKGLAAFRIGGDETDGTSFRAPYTGTYTVTAACKSDQLPYCVGSYTLSAGRDCPGDATTTCGIAVGQTLHGLQQHFAEDDDWFRASLRAGTTYKVSVARPDGSAGEAAVYDARGRRLAWAACPSGQGPCLTFTAPSDGRFHVSVPAHGDPRATYDLSLTR